MRNIWKFASLIVDVAVPLVAIWLIFVVFICPDYENPTLVMAGSIFVATHFVHPNYQVIGNAGRKSAQVK